MMKLQLPPTSEVSSFPHVRFTHINFILIFVLDKKKLILDPLCHQNQRIARCRSLESVHYIISDHVSAEKVIISDFLSTQLRRCLGKVCVGDPHGLHHLHLLLRLHHSPHHHPHLLHEAHQDNPAEGTYYVCDNDHTPAIVPLYVNLLIPHRKDLSIIWKVFQVLSAQLDLQATLSRGGTAKSRGQMRREWRDSRLTIMVAAMVCDVMSDLVFLFSL